MTVIREGIIRLRLEQQKTNLNAPEFDKWSKGYRDVEKAIKDAHKAEKEWATDRGKFNETGKRHTEDNTRAHRELERVVTTSNYRMITSFREGGEGALRMARGIAFLSASGGDSMQELARKVALAQGAFDVFAGGAKVLTSIGAVFGGPVAIGVGVTTAAITAGVVAWDRWRAAAERAKREQEELTRAAREFEKTQAETWNRQNQREAEAGRLRGDVTRAGQEFALTDAERDAALAREEQQLARELKAAEENRRRRVRGFRPGQFRGGEEEAFKALLEFGSPADKQNVLAFEQERARISRRQLEIDREQVESAQRQNEERFRREQELRDYTTSFFGFSPENKRTVDELARRELEAQNKAVIDAQRKHNQAQLEAFREATEKIIQLRKELDQGNAGR
jgi:hypothetical protein